MTFTCFISQDDEQSDSCSEDELEVNDFLNGETVCTTHLMWFVAVSDETEANEEVFHIMETETDDYYGELACILYVPSELLHSIATCFALHTVVGIINPPNPLDSIFIQHVYFANPMTIRVSSRNFILGEISQITWP